MRKFFVAALALQAPLALAQAADPPDSGKLEKITVTAERRLTALDDTPAAVTALNGTKLQEQGVTALADVVMLAPNTTFTTGQNASQIFIRGIGNVFLLAGGDPGVAMYADGAYVSDMTSINTALFDIQRVEVLRGPQGALYGRNATGGAVNIISARPTPTWQARLGALVGNYGRLESEGYLSGPLGASGTSVRLSYQVKEVDGYTDNPLAGQRGTPVVAGLPATTGPDKLDDLSSRAVRLQSLSDFGAGGTLRLIAGFYRQDDAGPSSAVLLEPFMNSGLLFNAFPSTDPRVVKSHGSENRVDVDSFIATYEVPVGRNTLHVTASHRKSDTFHDYDGDVTEGPAVWTRFDTRSTDKAIDVHLASEDGAVFQWLAGFTALRFDQSQDVRVSAQVPLGFLVPGAPLNVPFPGGVDVLLGGKVRARSEAFYVDGRYALSPQWAILGGVRYNRDKKEADEYQSIAAFGLAGRARPGTTGKAPPEWSAWSTSRRSRRSPTRKCRRGSSPAR
jgi:outer membrane receptor protein involved in Fe transport